ncbi:MAG: hypothetical protein BGO27_05285 [Alphaproteobacteria bacterium 33-17]|nr:MAG: hypothetical protein BGO27_05285 [Alphaproteobacteria bacterium 33-17]
MKNEARSDMDKSDLSGIFWRIIKVSKANIIEIGIKPMLGFILRINAITPPNILACAKESEKKLILFHTIKAPIGPAISDIIKRVASG